MRWNTRANRLLRVCSREHASYRMQRVMAMTTCTQCCKPESAAGMESDYCLSRAGSVCHWRSLTQTRGRRLGAAA